MELDKFFEKIPIDKVYEDLFQPGMKKAGEALATVIDAGNLLLLPIKLMNEKSRMYLQDNLKRYQEKLQKEETKKVIKVPEHVGLPIIDKLTYLNQKELSEAFINLLTKASFEETIHLVHPSFANILNNLSADEAKILFYLKDEHKVLFIDIHVDRGRSYNKKSKILSGSRAGEEIEYQAIDSATYRIARYLTGLEESVAIDFPENIPLYLENLEHNGLIKIDKGYLREDEDSYKALEETYQQRKEEAHDFAKKMREEDNQYLFHDCVKRGYFEFTEIGQSFIRACITDIQ